MNKITMTTALILVATQAQAATSFSCFSKYFTVNQVTIKIAGEVSSSSEVKNLKVDDESDGIHADLNSVKADPTYKPRKYKGYNLYSIDNNKGDASVTSGVLMLLPANLDQVTGRFDAYVSDALADSEGSSGYFRVLCQGK